jgi:hypothetical protein
MSDNKIISPDAIANLKQLGNSIINIKSKLQHIIHNQLQNNYDTVYKCISELKHSIISFETYLKSLIDSIVYLNEKNREYIRIITAYEHKETKYTSVPSIPIECTHTKLNTMPNANNISLTNPNINTINNVETMNTPSYKKETLQIKTYSPIFTEPNNNNHYTRYIKQKQVTFPSFKDVSKKLHFNYEYEDPLALSNIVSIQNETVNTQDNDNNNRFSRNENKSQNEELSLKQGENDNNINNITNALNSVSGGYTIRGGGNISMTNIDSMRNLALINDGNCNVNNEEIGKTQVIGQHEPENVEQSKMRSQFGNDDEGDISKDVNLRGIEKDIKYKGRNEMKIENEGHNNESQLNKATRIQHIIINAYKNDNVLTKLRNKFGNDFDIKITDKDVTDSFIQRVEEEMQTY